MSKKSDQRPFWEKRFKCPSCDNKFLSLRLFTAGIKVLKRDLYLQPMYEGINPNYYSLVACPKCYFASFESDFEHLYEFMDRQRIKELQNTLNKARKILKLYLGPDRTPQQALDIYSLSALTYYFAKDEYKLGVVFFRMGKIYKESEKPEKAIISLSKALRFFEKTFVYERIPDDPDKILFMIGSLYLQLNHPKEAFYWFEKLIKEKKHSRSAYVKAAKIIWEEYREGQY